MQPNGTSKGSVVVSWTGGKDGCFACYKAISEGYQVTHLLNFRNTKKIGSHEINPEVIQAQSEALGIPLIQRDFISYEQEFKRVVVEIRARGGDIDGAVFGHIQTHRGLVERICRDLEIELLLPIWKKDSYYVLKEIIDSGFKVVVVSIRDGLLGREWLGRSIDEGFVSDLISSDMSIDPCGENGEFHTLVVDGPIFKKRIVISKSDPKFQEGYWSMNIREFAVREK